MAKVQIGNHLLGGWCLWKWATGAMPDGKAMSLAHAWRKAGYHVTVHPVDR